MSLPENLVCNLIARNADKFVTVSFIAKDGNERTYNGRFNVKKYYKGTAKSEVVSERCCASRTLFLSGHKQRMGRLVKLSHSVLIL